MEITREILEKLYIQDKKSCGEIAKIFEVPNVRISRLLKKFSIPARPFSTKGLKTRLGAVLSEETKEKIRQKHLGKKLSPEHREKVLKTLRFGLKGEQSPWWKGGRIVTAEGYVLIKKLDHPSARSNGYVPEHRLVMESHIGRYLNPNEHIHHKNEITTDNRIENLQIVSPGEHSKIHWQQYGRKREHSEKIRKVRAEKFWSSKKKDY